MNQQCVNGCGCYLESQFNTAEDDKNEEIINKRLQKSAKRLEKYLDKFTKDERKAVDWAVSDYEFELALNKEEYNRLVRNLT